MRLVSNLRMRWDMETCFGLILLFLLLLLLLLSFSENTEHDAHRDTAALTTNMGALEYIYISTNKLARDTCMKKDCNKEETGGMFCHPN